MAYSHHPVKTYKTNLTLVCGHHVFWYGYTDDPKFPPPSTLWCRVCKGRVRTA